MKRYRVLNQDFDSRAWLLSQPILDSWDPRVRDQWVENKNRIADGLIVEYGSFNAEAKLSNFVDFGRIPFSVFSFHNRFIKQIQSSFVVGAFYPALVGACALGERILNHLVLILRDCFRQTPEYKVVYSKESFDDWDVAVRTLQAWNVLLPEAAAMFKALRDIRNRAVHFRPEVDTNDRAMALEAAKSLLRIVEVQFGTAGGPGWFIDGIPGEIYVSKRAEGMPFISRVYLPNCVLVGPQHSLSRDESRTVVEDRHDYGDREITDSEFVELRRLARGD